MNFIFGCAESSLVCGLFPPSISEQGLHSSSGAQASHCSSFSGCRAWPLGHVGSRATGSVVVALGLSCSAAGMLLQDLRLHPSPALEPPPVNLRVILSMVCSGNSIGSTSTWCFF